MGLNGERVELALALHECGAFRDCDMDYQTPPFVTVREGGDRGFRLKLHEGSPDAPLSPYFLQLRTQDNAGDKKGDLSTKLVQRIGTFMGDFAIDHGLRFDLVAGLPNAGDPFADAFPPGHPFIERRFPKLKLHKEEGDTRRIVGPPEGEYRSGQIVLVVDDLLTKANTKFEGIAVLESAGLRVTDVLVIVDRMQGGTHELRERGYTPHSLFTVVELLDIYVQYHRITPELYRKIVRYIGTS